MRLPSAARKRRANNIQNRGRSSPWAQDCRHDGGRDPFTRVHQQLSEMVARFWIDGGWLIEDQYLGRVDHRDARENRGGGGAATRLRSRRDNRQGRNG